MNLTDLKRNKKKSTRKTIGIEEFIEDANNYAAGKKTLVGDNPDVQITTAAFIKALDQKSVTTYRHATFTLTEKSIAQLNHLSSHTAIPKSKIIRILIDEFCHRTQHTQDKSLTKKVK